MDDDDAGYPPEAPLPETAEECRAMVARSIDRAVEERCVVRSELLDLAFELDSRAAALDRVRPAAGRRRSTVPRGV